MDLQKNLREFMQNDPEPHEETEEDFKRFVQNLVEAGCVMVAPPDVPGLDYLRDLGLPIVDPEDYDGELEEIEIVEDSDDDDDDDWIPF